jgi:hypothetical protein
MGARKKPILRSKIGALGKPNTKGISAANPILYRRIKNPFCEAKKGT